MFEGAAIVMGVASCGKTSVGQALAELLSVPFVEGDKLHPPANITKMSAGTPLTDEDRWPWLGQVGAALSGGSGVIGSCSALKRIYREHITKAAGRPVFFVFLDGERIVLERRIAARTGHFMPPALLDSQLATLQRPQPDELAKRFDIARPVAEIVEDASLWLRQQDKT